MRDASRRLRVSASLREPEGPTRRDEPFHGRAPRAEPATSFPDVVTETERLLVDALGLRPLAMPGELARAEGVWKERPTVIETRAYRGGAVAYARFARVWQPGVAAGEGLEIGNVLALGAPERALPILGADLVGTGPRGGMIAADLSPTLPPGLARDRQLAALAALAAGDAARAALTPGGELPDWCARFFSRHALFVRPEVGEIAAAVEAFRAYPDAFRTLASDPQSHGSHELARHVASVQLQYLAAHRTDDKGLGLLARIFGAAWAGRYVSEVLFPDQPPGWPVQG